MSFKIAKPRVAEIRKASPIVSRAEAVACGLCKKVQARYSCPTCNVPYCSLDCFRGEEHRDCSEGFYRSVIEEEIHSAPDRTHEEKRGMIEILQRLSNPTVFPGEDLEDSVAAEDDISSKLETLDIDSADADALWESLSPAQRLAFTKAMEDPNSSLARKLLQSLESEETEDRSRSPWWESQEEGLDPPHGTGSVPPFIQIPEPLILASQREWKTNSTLMLYNVVCLCLVYTFCIRTLQISSFSTAEPHDVQTCRQLISQAAPFLTDRKSTLRLETIDACIAYVQSRLKESVEKLLPDVFLIFQPPLVLEVSSGPGVSGASPPLYCWRLLACMGDIASLYTPTPRASTLAPRPSTDKATVHKLTFYAAHVTAAPMTQLRRIANEVAGVSASAGQEDERLTVAAEDHSAVVVSPDLQVPLRAGGDPAAVDTFARIEEIN